MSGPRAIAPRLVSFNELRRRLPALWKGLPFAGIRLRYTEPDRFMKTVMQQAFIGLRASYSLGARIYGTQLFGMPLSKIWASFSA